PQKPHSRQGERGQRATRGINSPSIVGWKSCSIFDFLSEQSRVDGFWFKVFERIEGPDICASFLHTGSVNGRRSTTSLFPRSKTPVSTERFCAEPSFRWC